MRAPAFWSRQRPGFIAIILYPLALIYALAVKCRFIFSHTTDTGMNIICVGNFVTGGAGKTPTAIALVQLLKRRGRDPVFLSRGYGGAEPGPTLIDPDTAHAVRFGDEPLLLARVAPTIVAKNRLGGAQMAADMNADIVIMDDGLQNPSLHKSISFAVVDAATGIGNGVVFPAGPLRASLGFQFTLIDAIIVVGKGTRADNIIARAEKQKIAVLHASITPHSGTIDVKNQKIIAYAGIGFPEKFFMTLKDAGADLVAGLSFPDHHRYTAQDAARLLQVARDNGGKLVTTEKDFARLSGERHLEELKQASRSFNVELKFDDEEAVLELLGKKLQAPDSRVST
ncbi:MAG: tetraacyldisaccharide 4'-kinase [Fimbriimonadaceae bacterium]|nr:tetraacyldisaccharide 4'-kinase [Alphaproteobacteria bacterium]